MKKIIFGITGLTLGGAERVLVDITNKLVSNYDITIFTIYNNGELEKELDKKIRIISLYNFRYDSLTKIKKLTIPIKVLLGKRKIYKKYIKGKYDCQISFLEGAITRIFSIGKNTKKIAWIHNDISKVFGKGIKSKVKRNFDRNVYEKYNTLVFVSIDNLDKFNKVYDDMQLPHETVINNYIDSKRILDLSKEELQEKDKGLFEEKNSIKLIQVSRLVEQKAIGRLIKVHSKLIKEGYNHTIIIIGDGSLKEKLKKQILDNNVSKTFKLLGAKTNPYPYIEKSDYFCLFSNFEGYPMVVEEAKILNKYILATNTATREALINYPNKNQIVENNEEGIEKAIKYAIKNINNVKKEENNYTYDSNKIIEKIIKTIEK